MRQRSIRGVVTIRWVVTSTKQSIYVDSEPRYEDVDDYSNIDRPVTVFAAEGSTVTVMSIVVKRLSGPEPKQVPERTSEAIICHAVHAQIRCLF
jgi:hypothetical protein